MVLGCSQPNRYSRRDSATPASRQTSPFPLSEHSSTVHSPDQPIQTEALRSGRRACQPARCMKLLVWSPIYIVHLTTDQKVRGSNPFGRATSSGFGPAKTWAEYLSRSVHCGPVVLLRCSSVSELFVLGLAVACCSAPRRPDLDGIRQRASGG